MVTGKWNLSFGTDSDIFYRIDHLLCIDLKINIGKFTLSTNDTVKMIDFSSIFYQFQMPYRYPQELDSNPGPLLIWDQDILQCRSYNTSIGRYLKFSSAGNLFEGLVGHNYSFLP